MNIDLFDFFFKYKPIKIILRAKKGYVLPIPILMILKPLLTCVL